MSTSPNFGSSQRRALRSLSPPYLDKRTASWTRSTIAGDLQSTVDSDDPTAGMSHQQRGGGGGSRRAWRWSVGQFDRRMDTAFQEWKKLTAQLAAVRTHCLRVVQRRRPMRSVHACWCAWHDYACEARVRAATPRAAGREELPSTMLSTGTV